MAEREDDERLAIQRVLGNEVQRWRIRKGWSLRELGEKAKFDHTYIGRVERGEQLPSPNMALGLDTALGTGGTFSEMLEAIQAGSAQNYLPKAAAREARAERIQVFTSSTVPSLLQTEGYARAMFRTEHQKDPGNEIEAAVAARLERKRVFSRDEPPLYEAIMDEAVLRRPVGGRADMATQLAHILKVAEEPDIMTQVVPFEHGEYWMLGGSLTLITAPNGSTVTYVESFGSGELVESIKRVVRLTARLDTVRRLALPEYESLELVKGYLEEYR